MDKDQIQQFIYSIRRKSPLNLSNGVIDDGIDASFFGYYNSKNRYLFYEKMKRRMGNVSAIVVNLHGGGFVKGLTTRDRIYSSYLALNTATEVWNAEYSLAPELPFPAALEDAYDLIMMAKHEKEERHLPLFVIGHSAGGWLIAALSVLLKRKGLENPMNAVILDYPPLDFTRTFLERVFDSSDDSQVEFAKTVEIFTEAYSPSGDKADGILSPLLAKDDDLSNFPDVFISVGEKDTLYPENVKFAERLFSLGKNVRMKLYPESGHSFTTNRNGRFEEALKDHVGFINVNIPSVEKKGVEKEAAQNSEFDIY